MTDAYPEGLYAAEEREYLRAYTDTRITDREVSTKTGAAFPDCSDMARIFEGSLALAGVGSSKTAALRIARRFIDEMDARGCYDESLFLLGREVCDADDRADSSRVMKAVCEYVRSLRGERLRHARAVISRMTADLT